MNLLLEVKSDKGQLSAEQLLWTNSWNGQWCVVHDVDEAIRAVNLAVLTVAVPELATVFGLGNGRR